MRSSERSKEVITWPLRLIEVNLNLRLASRLIEVKCEAQVKLASKLLEVKLRGHLILASTAF